MWPTSTRTALQSLFSLTSITDMAWLMPRLPQCEWSISMLRLFSTLLTTATWPRRMWPLARKLSTLPVSGRRPRA